VVEHLGIGLVVVGSEEQIFGHMSFSRLNPLALIVLQNVMIDVNLIQAVVVGLISLETGNPLVAGCPWLRFLRSGGFAF